IVKSAEPTPTSMCVLSPAARSRSSRSIPIAPVSPAATTIRSRTSAHSISGGVMNGFLLLRGDLLDSPRGQRDERVELWPCERTRLGGRLHLDQPAVAGHDDVHVDFGRG